MTMPSWWTNAASQPLFQWTSFGVGVLGTALTALGTWLTIKAKRSERTYEYLFRIADQNIDRELTEEEIAHRHKQLDITSSQLEALRKYIEKEIPVEAKRVVLQDRLRANMDVLQGTLESTMEIRRSLDSLGGSSGLYPDLIRAVQNEITPDFVAETKRADLKTYLTVAAVVTAISAIIVPEPFSLVITTVFAVISGAILLQLSKHYVPNRLSNDDVPMLYALATGFASGAFVSLALSWFAYGEWLRLNNYPYDQTDATTTFLVSFNMALFLVTTSLLIWFRYISLVAKAGSIVMLAVGIAGLALWTLVVTLNVPYRFHDVAEAAVAFGFFELALIVGVLALAAAWKASVLKRVRRRKN